MRLSATSGCRIVRARTFFDPTRNRRAPPFLFITGYGEIEQAVRLMREGARDYLTKPFVMSDFLAAPRARYWPA